MLKETTSSLVRSRVSKSFPKNIIPSVQAGPSVNVSNIGSKRAVYSSESFHNAVKTSKSDESSYSDLKTPSAESKRAVYSSESFRGGVQKP